ncbi:hypothetical protein OROMI_001617 [Orobanche minor]
MLTLPTKESDALESAVANLFASAKSNVLQLISMVVLANACRNCHLKDICRPLLLRYKIFWFLEERMLYNVHRTGSYGVPPLYLLHDLVINSALCLNCQANGYSTGWKPFHPCRTLCLLIAGQPADVFTADLTAVSNMSGTVNVPQQPAQIIAAHICYLVAEASFEPYSDSTRLCLIGADHWRPMLVQKQFRTKICEYSKTLGNSQFVLLPFQLFKYCQAVLKSLKTGRTLELENLRSLVSSLVERIKAHQQGGLSVNLAPKEFIGKLLNLVDSSAHRVIGGLPPPIPTAGGVDHGNENHYQFSGPIVSSSQSTTAMSSLIPESMEPINEWASDNRKTMHTRSVSEPDLGCRVSPIHRKKQVLLTHRTKRQLQVLRLAWAVLVLDLSCFRKLLAKFKRWVDEGAAPPAPEAALPPPPKAAVFQNIIMDNSPGMPPLPPSANQYPSRGRMGV